MTDKPSFRVQMRGYDQAEVDRYLADIAAESAKARKDAQAATSELDKIQSVVERLRRDYAAATERAATLEKQIAAQGPKESDYAALGDRIGQMLSLAEAEAAEMRATAHADAEKLTRETAETADQVRAAVDSYATDLKSKIDAEAAKIVANAQREADEILDHADREATARREEAEALYEHQRARANAAAADFEKTLADRRDQASSEFAAQMKANQEALAGAEERLTITNNEAERLKGEAQNHAATIVKAARVEASDLIEQARMAAEKVRRESDRELQAAGARRDAILAQLSNVRQMLATVGSASLVQQLDEVAAPVPVAVPVPEPAAAPEPAVDDAPTTVVMKATQDALDETPAQ